MKLAATYATEVFINRGGGLTIEQDHGEHAGIWLTREQARLVAAEIMRLDGDDSLWFPDKDESGNGTIS